MGSADRSTTATGKPAAPQVDPAVGSAGQWRRVLVVGLAALATVILLDRAIQLRVHPVLLREVEDAVRDYERSDPTVLVIGSSHGRSFVDVGKELERRTNGRESILAVPVEWGKLSSYAWVFEHRLRPILEEKKPDGTLRRQRLRRFILVTEWWDSTIPEDGGPAYNLPARAWTFGDFLRDVAHHGVNSYNSNYVSNRWRRLWSRSILVQDRGHRRIMAGLREIVRPTTAAARQRAFEHTASLWQAMIENGQTRILHPHEMEGMDQMLGYFADAGIEATILLYPRMPITMSEKGKRTTLATFSRAAQAIAEKRGLRFIDMTYDHPITDAEYAEDFDHVRPEGNERFARWALDGSLGFLLEP